MAWLVRIFSERFGGKRPSSFRAIGAATAAGAAVAVAVYRVLRH
jgi:hypothetical protein